MQTVIALLNNMVANKNTNMMLLFEEGMLSLVILFYYRCFPVFCNVWHCVKL